MNDFNNILYNLNQEPIEFNDYKYFDYGMRANVYKKENIVLKIYKSDCLYKYYIKKDLFNKLKELNDKNIVKLYNYYYFLNSSINKILPIDAYTMNYIKNDNINLLTINKEYLLNTIDSLENTCYNLSKNKIEIHDAHHSNIIFNNNGASIIDVDSFLLDKLRSTKKILLHNKKELLYYIKSKLKNEYYNLSEVENFYKLEKYLSFNLKNNITDEIDKIYKEDTFYNSLKKYI